MAATDGGAGRYRQAGVRTAIVGACGLLGLGGSGAEATEVRTAILGYTEPDRVSAFEAIIDGNHQFSDGKIVNFRLVYDALTGASASGATPASYAQTFTRPSGEGSYVTAPGETPLDDTFRDTRVAVSGGLNLPLGRLSRLGFGLYGSGEHDYTSLGANFNLTRDLNQKNTTLALRGAFFHDSISPEGGRPVPLSPMRPAYTPKARLAGDGTKGVMDLGLGLTQVLDRKTVLHLNYTFSHVTDYQSDPYKILTVVDASGDPRGGTDPMGADAFLFESRPDARTKHVLFGRVARHLGEDVVQFSYRYFTDDWGIASHTLDLTYRWELGGGKYLKPHVRYYDQAGADFYRRYLVDGEALPEHASADYRLGDMHALTYGLTYGRPVGVGQELTVRLEYYAQMGESHPADAIGVLKDYDLFPTVDAFIVQVGYSFGLLE
ncbi:DUF3570 domain-containing protein [bacterium]|nr:DUF3570 domain-containing protein [bacterium]